MFYVDLYCPHSISQKRSAFQEEIFWFGLRECERTSKSSFTETEDLDNDGDVLLAAVISFWMGSAPIFTTVTVKISPLSCANAYIFSRWNLLLTTKKTTTTKNMSLSFCVFFQQKAIQSKIFAYSWNVQSWSLLWYLSKNSFRRTKQIIYLLSLIRRYSVNLWK